MDVFVFYAEIYHVEIWTQKPLTPNAEPEARGAARGAAPLALAGSADELGAVLRLTFVPQLRAVRNLLGEILLGHLRGCGVLCRADAEAAAWLAPLGSAPRAEALGSP